MPDLPRLMPTSAANETSGGVTYPLSSGELVPVLTDRCQPQLDLLRPHHILLEALDHRHQAEARCKAR